MKKLSTRKQRLKVWIVVSIGALLGQCLMHASAQQSQVSVRQQVHPRRASAASNLTTTTTSVNARSITRGIKTDKKVYAEPPAPVLPPAGGTLIDPTFGTEVMRVTDEKDTAGATTGYSYWPTFNKTSTRLMVRFADSDIRIYEFDPGNFRLGSKQVVPVPPSTRGGAGYHSFEDAIWSGTDADVLYVHRGVAVFAYNVANRRYTPVCDLTSQFPAGAYFFQMSRSLDDDVFAFTLKDATYQIIGYVVYRRSTNRVIHHTKLSALDEVQLDKSGRFLVVKTGAQGRGAIEVRIIDVVSGAIEELRDDAPDYAPGHSDNGHSTVVGADNWLNRITIRSLATPRKVRTVLEGGQQWDNDFHVSMLADDESWVLVGFHGVAASGVLRRELVLVATDGSQRIQRFLHHHSVFRSYEDTPRANISQDGRFAAFTSNWGGRNRRDLFVARVPRAATLSLSLPPRRLPLQRLLPNRSGWALQAVLTPEASSQG